MDIQWYPGHMAKAKRLLASQIGKTDLVIELCDARLPLSSRNPALREMITRKRHVLLLCKADLADPASTRQWLKYFASRGVSAMEYDAGQQKTKQAKAFIESAAMDAIERARARGMAKTVRAMVVGVPNVGKSTFINRLYGGGITKVADRPGVTRSNQWVKVSPYLELMDSPGMLWPKQSDRLAATRLAYIGTISDAVYDQEELCAHLLSDLLAARPEATAERFRLTDTELRGAELIEAVCRGRGFLMRGGVCDTDRACAVVLDEFRSGKVGRVTLEKAPAPRDEAGL